MTPPSNQEGEPNTGLPIDRPTDRKPAPPREVDSRELLGGSRLVIIRHDGEAYRLMLTRNNRLVLQK